MNDLKLGFIGCGRHAQTCLYPSLAELGIRLQSVCALHLNHAQEAARKYGIPHAYDNYQTMIQKEHLDAVFIAVSGERQAQIVIDCLEAGAHVFVEKPLGSTVEEAQLVARAAKKTGKYVQVGFMKRFCPNYQKARLFMDDHKTFGNPVSFKACLPYGIFWICYNRSRFFLYAAIHNLDLLRYFLGEITDLHCVKKLTLDGVSYQFNFVSDQGVKGSMVIMGLFPWAHRKEEITITGTKTLLTIKSNEIISAGYIEELKAFTESLKNNKAAINTAEENLKTMKLYEKIIKLVG